MVNGYENILFTGDKIFSVEEVFNKQNNKIYAKTSEDVNNVVPKVQPGDGVSYKGGTSLHFSEKVVKTAEKVYQGDILEIVLKELSRTLFNEERWIFQEDAAPTYKAKTTQQWLKNNNPGFIAAEVWASGSEDLNLLG